MSAPFKLDMPPGESDKKTADEETKSSDKNERFKTFYAMSLAWQLGFLMVIPIVGFILLGIWLDSLWDTMPAFLIVGVVIGVFLSLYEIYHLYIPLLEKEGEAKKKSDKKNKP